MCVNKRVIKLINTEIIYFHKFFIAGSIFLLEKKLGATKTRSLRPGTIIRQSLGYSVLISHPVQLTTLPVSMC